MKKSVITICFFLAAAASFAGGIVEYKGQKYLYSPYAGNFAIAYETGEDLSTYQIDMAIKGGNLYFIGLGIPVNKDSILARGSVQNGDTFYLSDDSKLEAVYKGKKKQFDKTSIENGAWTVIGYSTKHKGVVITEVLVSQKEYDALESEIKEVNHEQ
jgi:hypothetical protein